MNWHRTAIRLAVIPLISTVWACGDTYKASLR
jgi:hypothetical protein